MTQTSSIRTLVEHLSAGWRANHADVARDLARQWGSLLNCVTEVKAVGDHYLRFTADIGQVRLLGMDNVICLAVSGSEAEATETLRSEWRANYAAGRIVCVLPLSFGASTAAQAVLPTRRALIFDGAAIAAMLEHIDPIQTLKGAILEQLDRRKLIPFEMNHAVSDHMFVGRSRPLRRLYDEPNVSFVVAGPGRIGKSSLLSKYRSKLVLDRDPRTQSTFLINLDRCPSKSADGVVQFIALSIESSNKNFRLKADRAESFFRFWANHFNRPVDLLLDEADEVFHQSNLKEIGDCAKQGLCRLVFAGKGVLLRAMLESGAPLECRLDMIRLEPLTFEEAATLILKPLQDLGFDFREPNTITQQVCELTGRLPHLIQFYGRQLCHMLLDESSNTLTPTHVGRVRDSFEATSYFMNAFRELKDPKSRLLACAFLGVPDRLLPLAQIGVEAARVGLIAGSQELWNLCNELVLQNVLSFEQNGFRLANTALAYYCTNTGFLQETLREARRDLSTARKP
jgi:hypothetical protein